MNGSKIDLKALGNQSFREGDIDKAVEYFSEAGDKEPSDSSIFSNLALAYIKLEKYENALQAADHALCLKNDNIKAFYRAYLACKSLQVYSRGRRYIRDALLYRPDNKLLLKANEEFKSFSREKKIRFLYTADELIFLLKRTDDTYYQYGLLAIKSLFNIFQDYYQHIDRTRIPGNIQNIIELLTRWSSTVALNCITNVNGLRRLEFHYRPFSRLILTILTRYVLEKNDTEALGRIVELAQQKYVRRNCGSYMNISIHRIVSVGLNGFQPNNDIRREFFRRGGLVPLAQGIAEYAPLEKIGKKLVRYFFEGMRDENSPVTSYTPAELVDVLKYLVFFKEWYHDEEVSDMCVKWVGRLLSDVAGRRILGNHASKKPPKFGWVFNDFCRFILDQTDREGELVNIPKILFERWDLFKQRQFDDNVKTEDKRWKKVSKFGMILM